MSAAGRVTCLFLLAGTAVVGVFGVELQADGFHVRPGENIQEAIEAAAGNPTNKVVKVHEGVYGPHALRPAMIWFNRAHDGVVVEAVGRVVLTAANPKISRKSARWYPAAVNHVVYFGHGISSNTVLRGFTITGARGYMTDKFVAQTEPDETVPKNSFFLTDGGAIKIFGKSSPTLENIEITDNYTTPCGGGVSVQQQGLNSDPVIFRDCVFRNNRAQVTGSAVDLLEGSAAILTNCLFAGNVANTGPDIVAKKSGEKPFINSGPLTIFQNSRALLQNCTFTGNRNGADDLSGASTYLNCIFYKNDIDGGAFATSRYELDLPKGGVVRNCSFGGPVIDPLKAITGAGNEFNAPDPQFDATYTPRAQSYGGRGYRPIAIR